MQSGKPGRAVRPPVIWIFIALGALFLGGALVDAYFTQKFLRESVTTDGTVVGLKATHRARRRRVTYAPVFRFVTEDGRPVTVVSHTSSNPPSFEPGEAVKVHYKKNHPDDAKIDSFGQLWLGDIVFGSVGAIFTAIGVLILLTTRKRNRPDLAVSDDGSGILRR
jgi:Protein of unknown function (DUF3592)